MDAPTATLTLARADAFAARAHSGQLRANLAPYIIHPRSVRLLLEQACVSHVPTLSAALLHDTVEDTPVTFEQLVQEFGVEIADIVAEVTDKMGMSREERHALQARHASSMYAAACIRIADRTYNLQDFYTAKPEKKTPESVGEYAAYSKTLYDRFKERAGREIENKRGDERSELEKAYLLLLPNMDAAVKQLAKKYPV